MCLRENPKPRRNKHTSYVESTTVVYCIIVPHVWLSVLDLFVWCQRKGSNATKKLFLGSFLPLFLLGSLSLFFFFPLSFFLGWIVLKKRPKAFPSSICLHSRCFFRSLRSCSCSGRYLFPSRLISHLLLLLLLVLLFVFFYFVGTT